MLKLMFEGFETITRNYSQAGQDVFVLMCLNGKRDGTFLDLGCGHPIQINNTYLLESEFGWYGLSVDSNYDLVSLYPNSRKSLSEVVDATKIDFDSVLYKYESNHIDYLSLDLEPASVTLSALKNIPLDKLEFSVITFEHDMYRFGGNFRDESRQIFSHFGYKIICSDVRFQNNIYEDWYFNPKYIKYEDVKVLECENQEWEDILFKQISH